MSKTMSGMNGDQLHRLTIGIYASLMDQFNPGLQRLVALGNNYIQAYQALAGCSEAYFSALGKMGEHAMQTMSSHLLGDILIKISESQRRLTSELDGVFRWFHNEVLQQMENNLRLDKTYISDSRRNYESEVRNQALALEYHHKRGGRLDGGEYMQFLRDSQQDALLEEERRYRFLAEKHCGLTSSLLHLMNKTGNNLQQRTEEWQEQVNQTRMSHSHTSSSLEHKFYHGQALMKQPLGHPPSRGPSPQPPRSRSSSLGESSGLGGGRMMQALVPHLASSNSTLLSFNKGEMITVLVSEPRNGWLYGRSEVLKSLGWFPAAFVGAIEGTNKPSGSSSSFTSSSSSSMSNLFYHSANSRTSASPPPPPPPPITKSSDSRPVTPSILENKQMQNFNSRPELFPRGTNPFATVKLKPTTTNDRSTPRIF